jgi:hypothetical protein
MHILRTAAKMRRNVTTYARDLADRYLARYGLSYDAWMAAVSRGAVPVNVARAGFIERDLRREAASLRRALVR